MAESVAAPHTVRLCLPTGASLLVPLVRVTASYAVVRLATLMGMDTIAVPAQDLHPADRAALWPSASEVQP